MPYRVACWNVEKNGQTSALDKQAKVSQFIDTCIGWGVDVVFLCEIHSARVDDYDGFAKGVYGMRGYDCATVPGAYSNNYVVMWRRDRKVFDLGHAPLLGLNRSLLAFELDNKLAVGLAHFKSGQSGLTKSQLEHAAGALESFKPGYWAVLGDMNWDFGNAGALAVPAGSHSASCWADQTQANGGILDWTLAGWAVNVKPFPLSDLLPGAMCDMTGPDHRPVIFEFDWVTI